MKKFRVLNISDSEMEVTNQRIAIVELVEIDVINSEFTNSNYTPYTFGNEGKRYIVAFNSDLNKTIINHAQNEELIKLDLSDFRFRNEIKNGIREEIGYHKNVHLIGFDKSPENQLEENAISNTISQLVYEQLEFAFIDLMASTENPLVIAHLQSNDKQANVYLVAKNPNEKLYYGIVETEFVKNRKLTVIPESNILTLDVKQVSMTPFRTKKYIEQGIKE
jgi:hypothetical protein